MKVAPSLTEPSFLHTLPEGAPPDPGPSKPVAVLICHGMGQQVPFETLSGIARHLAKPAGDGPAEVETQVRHVRFRDEKQACGKETWLPRAEIEVAGLDGEEPRTVHVYEAYWAPLTEGRISLTEVVQFLVRAGIDGILRSRNFWRWLFGGDRRFPSVWRTPLYLVVVLLLVVALVVINSLLAVVAGVNAAELAGMTTGKPLLVDMLTRRLWWVLGAGIGTGALLWLSSRQWKKAVTHKPPQRPAGSLLEQLGWIAVLGATGVIIVLAIIMVFDYLTLSASASAVPQGTAIPVPPVPIAPERGMSNWVVWPTWGLTLLLSYLARSFFVQFLGDVAIYLSGHRVDKFNKVRQQIKRVAYQTACAIYGARVPEEVVTDSQPSAHAPAFAYDHIVLVGHSLGAVVTYDALNATRHLDETMGDRLRVADRTAGFITFGTPLDKTAFLFSAQHPGDPARNALVASVQPLVREEALRKKIRWINIFSANDPISGKLNFYDLPGRDEDADEATCAANGWVCNKRDEQAITPLIAHTQYWDNPLLTLELRRAIHRGSLSTQAMPLTPAASVRSTQWMATYSSPDAARGAEEPLA